MKREDEIELLLNVRVILVVGIVILMLVLGGMLFGGCASQRYDNQGNGTWPSDKAVRWAVHAVNDEGY